MALGVSFFFFLIMIASGTITTYGNRIGHTREPAEKQTCHVESKEAFVTQEDGVCGGGAFVATARFDCIIVAVQALSSPKSKLRQAFPKFRTFT